MTPDPEVRLGARSKNLNIFRLILVTLVALEYWENFSHATLGSSENFSLHSMNIFDVAVTSFFIISGMLTWSIIERNPDIIRFRLRRFFQVIRSSSLCKS